MANPVVLSQAAANTYTHIDGIQSSCQATLTSASPHITLNPHLCFALRVSCAKPGISNLPLCPVGWRSCSALAVNRRCDMADGRSGGRLGESFSPAASPLGCKWKVTAVINPFSPHFFILQILSLTGRVFTEGHKYTKFHFSLFFLFFALLKWSEEEGVNAMEGNVW